MDLTLGLKSEESKLEKGLSPTLHAQSSEKGQGTSSPADLPPAAEQLGEASLGTLDLGGRSTQVTFTPKHEATFTVSPADFLHPMVFGRDLTLYSHSYLGQDTSSPPSQHNEASPGTHSKIVKMEENLALCGKLARISQLDGAADSDEWTDEDEERPSKFPKVEASEVQEVAPAVPDRRISPQILRICNHILENPLINNTGLLQVSCKHN